LGQGQTSPAGQPKVKITIFGYNLILNLIGNTIFEVQTM
jgi:hypothetical protein